MRKLRLVESPKESNNIHKKTNKKQLPQSNKVYYVIIILVSIMSLYFFVQSPFFRVNKIYVTGTEQITINQVTALADVYPGVNILRINSAEVEKKLVTQTWIKEAVIEKKLPSTINIKITERQPKAIVQTLEGYLVLDDSGMVLIKLEYLTKLVLPIITNFTLEEDLLVGEIVQNKQVIEALQVIGALPDAIGAMVSEFSLGEGLNLFLAGGLEIKLGSSDKIAEKLQVLTDIFNNTNEEVLEKVKYIDLRFNGPPIIKYGT